MTTPIFTPEQFEFFRRLESIFMPYAQRQRESIYKPTGDSAKFVHYTSAEAALSIIRTKRIWMRNATCMSDYLEVQHGFKILNGFFSDESRRKMFTDALDACLPGAAMEGIDLFGQWWNNIRFSTYIASISEHDSEKEDLHGRLSMWRAFGGSAARVALVLEVPWFSGAASSLGVMFSPVAYLKEEEVHEAILEVIENIRSNEDFLRSAQRSFVIGTVFNMLVAGVCCLKHEGFREEREWRIICNPARGVSPLVEPSVITVGGIPQIVYNLPLDEKVSDSLAGIELARMFDRLIIGPSQFSLPMYQAFVMELKNAGVSDAEQRVVLSGIPIRT